MEQKKLITLGLLSVFLAAVFLSLPVYFEDTVTPITPEVLENPAAFNTSNTTYIIAETSLEAIAHNVSMTTTPPIRNQLFEVMYYVWYTLGAIHIVRIWEGMDTPFDPYIDTVIGMLHRALYIECAIFSVLIFVLQRGMI